MTSATATALPPGPSWLRPFQVGRMFVNPAFDYLLIGGGLSLLLVGFLYVSGGLEQSNLTSISLPVFVLLSNTTHFAASTVRLYTKPGAVRELPFLTMVFPLVTIAILTLAIVFSGVVGRNLNALYLTWSPYHYAAQTYGLAVMYAYRSGCRFDDSARRLVRWTCLLPFLYAFVVGKDSGLDWFVPEAVLTRHPLLLLARGAAATGLRILTFALPVFLVVRLYWKDRTRLPFISMLMIVTNAFWWIVFTYIEAFMLATVFHGVQYLAIVSIFHVRDQQARPGPRRSWLHYTVTFYLTCLALGYALFDIWPYAYVLAGFGLGESMLLVVAVINIHHFIVDRYIWQLRKDPNYKIVVGQGSESVPTRP